MHWNVMINFGKRSNTTRGNGKHSNFISVYPMFTKILVAQSKIIFFDDIQAFAYIVKYNLGVRCLLKYKILCLVQKKFLVHTAILYFTRLIWYLKANRVNVLEEIKIPISFKTIKIIKKTSADIWQNIFEQNTSLHFTWGGDSPRPWPKWQLRSYNCSSQRQTRTTVPFSADCLESNTQMN